MENPTATWDLLHDRFYRKVELYELAWKDMDLSMYIVAAAPYGGPLGMVRHDRKILRVQRTAVKPDISIYSPAGLLLATVPWDKGRIIELGWSRDLELLAVVEDGTVFVYDVQGSFLRSFSLGKEVKQAQVIMARVWESGLVALTSEYKLVIVTDLADPRPRKMADLPDVGVVPTCLGLLLPQHTVSGQPEVLVGIGAALYSVDFHSAVKMPLLDGPYTQVAVSPDGKLLALFTMSGHLYVVSSDLSQQFSETNTNRTEAPTQLVWCGVDSVVAAWETEVLMIGPYSDWLTYTYEGGGVVVAAEVDGARIYSPQLHELLQKVPGAVEDIFKYGSTEPSSRLYDAAKLFEERNVHADELLRSLKGEDLHAAVRLCIEAAGQEFDPHLQKQLLKAASFGKAFMDDSDPEPFLDMCRTLRVLNAVRHHDMAMPLTYAQYTRLKPQGVIHRLLCHNAHCLAFRICEYLELNPSSVLVHWACQKVRVGTDDDAVCDAIVNKLSAFPGISFATVASAAQAYGKPALAIRLLDHEPRAEDQVPLLITLHEDELALVKAIASGDTDLVYMALLHLKRKLPLADFLHIIHNKPVACNLLVQWCKDHDKALLKDFYYQDDRLLDLALLQIRDVYGDQVLEERLKDLRIALGALMELKDAGFYKTATEDQIALLRAQKRLESLAEAEGTPTKYVDLSLADTIYALLLGRRYKLASDLKRDLRVSDKQFWWIKVRALAFNKDWAELDRFAKSRKSPIGYEPFVEECLAKGAMTEAVKYIPKCPPDTRVAYYCEAGFFREAVEAATAMRSREALELVRRKCGNRRDIIMMLDRAVGELPA